MSSVAIRDSSAWSIDEIETFLMAQEIPLRLGMHSGAAAPLVCSLWYLYDDAAFWCATQKSAKVVSLLERQADCAFEVAGDSMPYRGVRGQGHATLLVADGPAILTRLVDRYLHGRNSNFAQWLLKRSAHEVAIRINPLWLTSWDFTARMSQ